MTRSALPILAALLAVATAGTAQEKLVTIAPHAADRRVDVLVDGQPFTSYIWPSRLANRPLSDPYGERNPSDARLPA